MIRSMTGYGEATCERDGAHYFAEVRSLNNKYLKVSLRLPEALQALEAEVEARLRARLTRGTVTLNASCTDASAGAAHTINDAALRRYFDQLRSVTGPPGMSVTVELGAMLALPGVLQPPADEEDRIERARAALLPLVDRAVDGLLAMREREGRMLVADLEDHRKYIAVRLASIKELAPGVVSEYERRLKARIDALLAEATLRVDPVDVIREIAVYAERTDIAEEIARLGGHLDQFAELISAADERPVGRTLDFLAQEMLREANTIASKSPDSSVSRQIVEVKGAIDRIKEQAANVE